MFGGGNSGKAGKLAPWSCPAASEGKSLFDALPLNGPTLPVLKTNAAIFSISEETPEPPALEFLLGLVSAEEDSAACGKPLSEIHTEET